MPPKELGSVPAMTEDGTFLLDGNQWTLAHRLARMSGPYYTIKDRVSTEVWNLYIHPSIYLSLSLSCTSIYISLSLSIYIYIYIYPIAKERNDGTVTHALDFMTLGPNRMKVVVVNKHKTKTIQQQTQANKLLTNT